MTMYEMALWVSHIQTSNTEIGLVLIDRERVCTHTHTHTHRERESLHTERAYETYKHAHTQRAYDTYKHMYTHTELRTGSGVSHATCITATTLDFSLLEVVAVLSFKEGLCCSGPGPEHQALIHANLASHTFALVPALKSNWK